MVNESCRKFPSAENFFVPDLVHKKKNKKKKIKKKKKKKKK